MTTEFEPNSTSKLIGYMCTIKRKEITTYVLERLL